MVSQPRSSSNMQPALTAHVDKVARRRRNTMFPQFFALPDLETVAAGPALVVDPEHAGTVNSMKIQRILLQRISVPVLWHVTNKA